MLYRTRRVVIGLTLPIVILTSGSLAKEKVGAGHMSKYAPAESVQKRQQALQPGHLYVKSEEQLKREFFYRKQKQKEFQKMKEQQMKYVAKQKAGKAAQMKKGEENE